MALGPPRDVEELGRRSERIWTELRLAERDIEREEHAWNECGRPSQGKERRMAVTEVWTRYRRFCRETGMASFPFEEIRLALFFLNCAQEVKDPRGLIFCGEAFAELADATAYLYPSHTTVELSTTLLPDVIRRLMHERLTVDAAAAASPQSTSRLDGMELNRDMLDAAMWRYVEPAQPIKYLISHGGVVAYASSDQIDTYLRAAEIISSSIIAYNARQKEIDAKYEADMAQLDAVMAQEEAQIKAQRAEDARTVARLQLAPLKMDSG